MHRSAARFCCVSATEAGLTADVVRWRGLHRPGTASSSRVARQGWCRRDVGVPGGRRCSDGVPGCRSVWCGPGCGRNLCCVNPGRRTWSSYGCCAPARCFLGLIAGFAESLTVGVAGGPAFCMWLDVVDVPDRCVAPRCAAGLVPCADQPCQPGGERAGLGFHRGQFPGQRVQVQAAQTHQRRMLLRWLHGWVGGRFWSHRRFRFRFRSGPYWSVPSRAFRVRRCLPAFTGIQRGADQLPPPDAGNDAVTGEVRGGVPVCCRR